MMPVNSGTCPSVWMVFSNFSHAYYELLSSDLVLRNFLVCHNSTTLPTGVTSW